MLRHVECGVAHYLQHHTCAGPPVLTALASRSAANPDLSVRWKVVIKFARDFVTTAAERGA